MSDIQIPETIATILTHAAEQAGHEQYASNLELAAAREVGRLESEIARLIELKRAAAEALATHGRAKEHYKRQGSAYRAAAAHLAPGYDLDPDTVLGHEPAPISPQSPVQAPQITAEDPLNVGTIRPDRRPIDAAMVGAPCRHCSQPVVRDEAGDTWWHRRTSNYRCRPDDPGSTLAEPNPDASTYDNPVVVTP